MAQAEPRNDVAGGGFVDGRGAAARDQTHCGVAGDEFVTTMASTLSCGEPSKCVTSSVIPLQMAAAIEISREQWWSEVADRVKDGAGAASSGCSVDDKRLWEKLKQLHPRKFVDSENLVKLGRVIAEGGQSIIYEASAKGAAVEGLWVAKVFKMEGFSLAKLQRQWPRATKAPRVRNVLGGNTLSALLFGGVIDNCCPIYFGTFLKDGRFAFLMKRCWGDLRTLIDMKLDRNFPGRPPFSHREALRILRGIANGMMNLHERGVLHRDLKAANILIESFGIDPRYEPYYHCEVADYESSRLVQGSGFWRAPEVLEHLLKKPSCHGKDMEKVWTKKADVYSFAMLCFEVLTGHTPFSGYRKGDWKKVIDGERPHLPDYILPETREVVQRCWHKVPAERPTFKAIAAKLKGMLESLMMGMD